MTLGRVLIIEDDEWESLLLKRVLVAAGYSVELAGTARDGVTRAKVWQPDCIVCDLALPDIEGYWVARTLRTDTSLVASTPFLFIASESDENSRLQGFNVGADAYVTKPYRAEEVVAQIIALITMARRMERRESYGPSSSNLAPAMRGDIGQLDLSTILTVLSMDRRTGRLKVRTDGGETASFELLDGQLQRSSLDGNAMDATLLLKKVIGWRRGRFWFRALVVKRGPLPAVDVGPLLLEAMRLIDEAKR